MSLSIQIRTTPHSRQRYETCGDWFYLDNGDIHIVVSDMGDWKKEFLVALHELVEATLCKARGIKQMTVDRFDIEYEASRQPNDAVTEPGDDPKSPYYKEHFFATNIERMLANELGVDWGEYEQTVQSLSSYNDGD
jgi:hypothetical protein